MTAPQRQVACRECGRTFCRQGDLKRHKCQTERSKPVQWKNRGAQPSVQSATDGSRVLEVSVHTDEESMDQKIDVDRPFQRAGQDRTGQVCVCVRVRACVRVCVLMGVCAGFQPR